MYGIYRVSNVRDILEYRLSYLMDIELLGMILFNLRLDNWPP